MAVTRRADQPGELADGLGQVAATEPASVFQSAEVIASPGRLVLSGCTVCWIVVAASRTGPRLASGMSAIGVLRNRDGSISNEMLVSPTGSTRIGWRITGSARLGWRIASSYAPAGIDGRLTVPSRNGRTVLTTSPLVVSVSSTVRSRLTAGKPRMLSFSACMLSPNALHGFAVQCPNGKSISQKKVTSCPTRSVTGSKTTWLYSRSPPCSPASVTPSQRHGGVEDGGQVHHDRVHPVGDDRDIVGRDG